MTATRPSRARSVEKPTKSSATPEREVLLNRTEMTDMRDHAVPCLHATQYETLLNRHTTWEDDRICTRCKRTLDVFAYRRAFNEQIPVDESVDFDPRPV